jgi:ABC-type spermidine/putrescine transport system permease subunit I
MSTGSYQDSGAAGQGLGGRIQAETPGLALAVPGLLLLTGLCVVPLVAVFVQALGRPGGPGFGTEALGLALTEAEYRTLLWRSLGTATLVTLVSVAIAWPVAWTIAKVVRPNNRALMLALIMVPFLTSQLLLIYAMLVLLGAGGPMMTVLDSLHLASADASILYTPWATRVMFIYESISVIVLILFVASERIDDELVAASRSMGASRISTFMNVIWPGSVNALSSAVAITFVATAGAFAESAVLGGPRGSLLGNAIADRLQGGGSADVTSALAVVLLVTSLACVALLVGLIRRLASPLRPVNIKEG